MKNITSTTGETIKFLLRGTEPLHIDTEAGVTVTDLDAQILIERLGSQLKISETSDNTPTPTEVEDYEAEVASVDNVKEAPVVSETIQDTPSSIPVEPVSEPVSQTSSPDVVSAPEVIEAPIVEPTN